MNRHQESHRLPVHLLMLSKDQTLLSDGSGFGDTLSRHIYYVQRLRAAVPLSEIRIVVYSSKALSTIYANPAPGLHIYGTASRHRALFLLDAGRLIPKVMADGWKPTVVTTQEPYEEGQLGLWLAHRYQAHFIPQLHFDLLSAEWLKESRLNPLRRLIAGYVLKHADAVRAVSSQQKRVLVQQMNLNADRIHVIPVGVSLKPSGRSREECKQSLPVCLVGHQTVLFVGRFCSQKNLSLWVDVAQHIREALPKTVFLLAGDGPQFQETKNLVWAKGLSEAFVFLGSVPYHLLPDVYGAADLFLLTSHYEGFGRVIMEAQMARVPVIATACTGPEDLITEGKTGYLRQPGDRAGLAAAAISLLRDEEKLRSLGACGRLHAESRFGRERLADDLVQMWSAS